MTGGAATYWCMKGSAVAAAVAAFIGISEAHVELASALSTLVMIEGALIARYPCWRDQAPGLERDALRAVEALGYGAAGAIGGMLTIWLVLV